MNVDATTFSVTTDTSVGEPVLRLSGRVDRDAEAPLLHAFEAALGEMPRRVILDFAATDYINSSGLAAVVGVLAKAKSADVAVAARGLTAHYRHIFEITRLADLVEIEPATGTEGTGAST